MFSDVLLFQLVRYKNKQKSVILRFEKKGSLTLRVQGGISDYLTIAAIWLFFSISRAVCQFEGTNGHPHNEGSSSSCTAPIQQWSIRFFFSISRAVCQFKGTNGHPHNEGSSSSCTTPIQQWSIRFFFSISRAVRQFEGTNCHPHNEGSSSSCKPHYSPSCSS